MSEYTSIPLEDIITYGNSLPNGMYDAVITNIETFTTKNGAPALKVTADVTSGPQKNLDHSWYYFLKIYPPKPGKANGRPFSSGITSIVRDAKEVGVYDKLPKAMSDDPALMKRAYHKAFNRVPVRLHISDGTPNSEGKTYKETRLLAGNTYAPEGDEPEQMEERIA